MPSAPPEYASLNDIPGARELVGYRINAGAPEEPVRVTLDVEPKHANRVGMLHGGIIAMMLDAACGFAASKHFGKGEALTPLVTLTLTTSFVAGAKIRSRVTAVGTVTGGGRKIAYASGELRDDAGQILATAQGSFRAIKYEVEI